MPKPKKWSGPQYQSYRNKYGAGTKTNFSDKKIEEWLTAHRQGANRMSQVAKIKKLLRQGSLHPRHE